MSRYSYDNFSVDNSANLFVLREDIHTAYDNIRWTIAPKTPSAASEPKWYFVYLDRTEEMGSQYHNVEMRPMLGVRSEYLLAGFARAIFYLLLPFLNNCAPKWLIGKSVDSEDPAGKEVSGIVAAEVLRLPGTRGGRTSPQKDQSPKRQRTEDASEACNDSVPNGNTPSGPEPDSKRSRLLPNDDHDDPPPRYHDSAQPSKRSSKNSYDPNDIPCTCPIDTSPVAEESTSEAKGEPQKELVLADIICRSKNCRTLAESKYHEAVRIEALKHERTKSNVQDWWEGQLQWARDCSLRKRRGYNLTHRFWVTGAEEQDKYGEYVDTDENFGRMIGWRS
ncbi:MAG: hypothetical protein Q9173_002046 [Seirophora scorigena]